MSADLTFLLVAETDCDNIAASIFRTSPCADGAPPLDDQGRYTRGEGAEVAARTARFALLAGGEVWTDRLAEHHAEVIDA